MLATVLDRKTGAGGTSSLYDHWSADLASVTDYYPGGMMMPGRNLEHDWSRMGMQGQQKDDEVYGKGNFVDLGERNMDTRLNRLGWRVDPLAHKFPSQSPYVYAGNSPIQFIDKNGAYKYPKGKQGDTYKQQYPMITLYLANYVKTDVEKSTTLSNEIIKYADNKEFGKKELSNDVLTWSDKSTVTINFVESETIYGANAQTQNSKSIYVNKDYAQAVEDILSDKGKKYTNDEKQQAVTAFFITMMDETTLVGSKYTKDPIRISDGGSDGDVGNDLTDAVFYKKNGENGYNRVGYQADKNTISGTSEVIKTIKDEGRSDVLPTTPKK